MAAGDKQRQVREGRWLGLEERREEVSFEMVYPDRWQPPCVREAARQGGAGEQRPDEAGSRRIRHAVQVARAGARPLQRALDQRQQPPHVVAGGELRDHATIRAVQLDLAEELVREEPRACIEHRGGTLVTGGFDGQHSHGITLSQSRYAVCGVRATGSYV